MGMKNTIINKESEILFSSITSVKDLFKPQQIIVKEENQLTKVPAPFLKDITKFVRYDISLLTSDDIKLFKEGKHCRLYEKLGSHAMTVDGLQGVFFAVWAPEARAVSVIADFNNWDKQIHPLRKRDDGSGIWECFIPEIKKGSLYKYFIVSNHNNYQVEKRDPFSFYCEMPPARASVVTKLDYQWKDEKWIKERAKTNALDAPYSVYEMHLGSWKRILENNRYLTYTELADEIIEYIKEMGFTHVEFLPLMDHPFYGSWGYQTDGYFSPSPLYGKPHELMYLIDRLHQENIGVILDWVPSHFVSDKHGLSFFDGTHVYEHGDPRLGYHPDWKSSIFNYGKPEVRSFLISSAHFWIEKYHGDGLRVDGGASMLYLDYSRKPGEWVPNKFGGRENIDAIEFLKQMNTTLYTNYPDIQMIAEESTSWGNVSRPVSCGGLGFGMKWNMGWMHDILRYFSKDHIHRKHHHNDVTFSMLYAFKENFMLSLSHDEVVHGKGSLITRMPGDEWQKFANMRLLFGYMYAHPGKKLLFMGDEFAQGAEWNHNKTLDWELLNNTFNQGVKKWIKDLNQIYKTYPALFRKDFIAEGFEWIDFNDWQQSIISFVRKAESTDDEILVVCNFTPIARYNYRIGAPRSGIWKEILNSNSKEYGGEGQGNPNGVLAENIHAHGKAQSLSLTLPPLSVIYFKREEVSQ